MPFPLALAPIENQLLLFAKAPRRGAVKSRLAATIGDDAALEAYIAMLRALASRLRSVEHITVLFDPPDAQAELTAFFPSTWIYRPQHGENLGARIYNGFCDAFATGAQRAAAIGADCPLIEPSDISAAWRTLDSADVVFGPATDGGYWLIGTKSARPELFQNVKWSSSNVLERSIANARAAQLKVTLLRELSDIDTEADWRAFLKSQTIIPAA